MSNKNILENEPEIEPAADKGNQSAAVSASKIMENTETVTGSSRHIVDAGLLGTCVVFLAAMLGMSQKQIDTPLTIALVAFAVAIPILVYGFLFAFHKAKPVVPGWRILAALLIGAWIAEGFGEFAVIVGVFAVIAHLSLLALHAFVSAVILVILFYPS